MSTHQQNEESLRLLASNKATNGFNPLRNVVRTVPIVLLSHGQHDDFRRDVLQLSILQPPEDVLCPVSRYAKTRWVHQAEAAGISWGEGLTRNSTNLESQIRELDKFCMRLSPTQRTSGSPSRASVMNLWCWQTNTWVVTDQSQDSHHHHPPAVSILVVTFLAHWWHGRDKCLYFSWQQSLIQDSWSLDCWMVQIFSVPSELCLTTDWWLGATRCRLFLMNFLSFHGSFPYSDSSRRTEMTEETCCKRCRFFFNLNNQFCLRFQLVHRQYGDFIRDGRTVEHNYLWKLILIKNILGICTKLSKKNILLIGTIYF